MKLQTILGSLNNPYSTGGLLDTDSMDTVITGLCYDSRKVNKGDLFFCIRGEYHDGHDYASAAVDRGASVVIVDHELDVNVLQIKVEDVRSVMAEVAEIFFNFPAREIMTVGVTGTNGKTTTVNLLEEIASSSGEKTGIIGTLTGERTTPEAPELQEIIRSYVKEGKSFLSMEVSSHALLQKRISGMKYDLAIFTNLTVDHLDYHGDMESYYQAKLSLFTAEHADHAVINTDTSYGQRLAREIEIPFTAISSADIEVVKESFEGSIFKWKGELIEIQLPGYFNIENAYTAATAAHVLGFDKDSIVTGLSQAQAIPGRFEVVNLKEAGPIVVVDYSHTPDGLQKVLQSAQRISGLGDVHVVFGCGGNRDRSKRPQMAAVSEKNASYVYVTSDNPRSEDEQTIINDVLEGFNKKSDIYVEPNRRKAIMHAIQISKPADVVIVAGKGNEETQEISGEYIPFKDIDIAIEGLQARKI